MRETYARVLAGALVTGAIAAVVGMSALFETGKDAPLRVVAPPATLQRPVPIEVAPAAVRPQKHAVRRAVRTVSRPVHTAVVTRPLVTIKAKRPGSPAVRHLASSRPKPKPARVAPPTAETQPAPAEVASVATPEPAPLVETAGDAKEHPGHAYGHDKDHGNGNGNAYGHDKQKE
jgi:hypothetical protein